MSAPPPVPALPDTERRTSYSASGSVGPFGVGFALYGDSTDYGNWLQVWVNNVLISPVFYTITSPTGPLATIPRPITDAVLTFSLAQTGIVQIVGARRPRRISQFQEGTGVPARNLNQTITDAIAQLRESWDMRSRLLQVEPGSQINLPSAAQRANTILGFDSSGQVTTLSPVSTTFTAGATFNSRTAAAAATIAGGIQFVQTAGFATAGDGGDALYGRTGSSAPGGFQSADGSFWKLIGSTVSVNKFGAKGDGAQDNASAFTTLSSFISGLGGGFAIVPPGIYKIGSNVTLTGQWLFAPGAVLTPSAGVTVILAQAPENGLYQIFDLTAAGSLIQLPGAVKEVWAEWWGAKGDNTKTNNEKPFQQAINALESDVGTGGTGGGVVRAGRGIFLFSSSVTISNLIRVVGVNCRYTRLRANSATWSGQDTFWIFENVTAIPITGTTTAGSATITGIASTAGITASNSFVAGTGIPAGAIVASVTSTTIVMESDLSGTPALATASGTVPLTISRHDPQFNCRLEEVEVDCGDVAAIQIGIYSDCWNEQCGLQNVLLYRFNHVGVWFEHGYGGTATFEFNQCEIFPGAGAAATAIGMLLDNDSVQTPTNIRLNHVVFGCDGSAVLSNQTGIRAQGLVTVVGSAVHFENLPFGLTVAEKANIVLDGVTGGTGVTDVFSISSGWTGRIDCHGVMKGGASKLLSDTTTGYKLYDNDQYTLSVIYPPDPTQGISACRVTSGAAVYTVGRLVYAGKGSTGTYSFNITPVLNASTDFEVMTQLRDGSVVIAGVINQSSSGFQVVFKNPPSTLTDVTDFYVELRHRP